MVPRVPVATNNSLASAHPRRVAEARILALLVVAGAAAPLARAQTTTAVSVDSAGVLSDSFSFSPSVSANGRFVAFSSGGTNLVPNDTNFSPDVFLRDRFAGTTVRVSVDSAGAEGDSISWFPSISADGRFIAFGSFATNLVANDTNSFIDAFVHDMQTGQTTRVSVSSTGVEGNASVSNVSISADGRFVAFDCDASNLVAGDTNGVGDVFLHDNQTGETRRVSVDSAGAEGNGLSYQPGISADGRFVTFTSQATNLVAGDTNIANDVFVYEILTAQTTRVSLSSLGLQAVGGDSGYSSISADGRFVSFESGASNLVVGDINGMDDVFVRDRLTGTTTLASVGPLGVLGNGFSAGSSISATGRHVSFFSSATNLVPGGTLGSTNVFVRDLQTGVTTLVSQDNGGVEGNDGSFFSSVSAGGNVIAFESNASNFVAGDLNFNSDIFARDAGGPPVASFCPGDGTGTACPCGNNGAAGRGCAHSLDANGSLLSGSGAASVAGDSLFLSASFVPNGPGLYFQGTAPFAGGSGVVFGDGLLCAGGSILRLGVVFATGNASQFPRVGIDPPMSVAGGVVAGDLRYYQLWFRDANTGFCSPAVFNLTNGTSLTWAP
jgi:Tol biopolymer transport system component